MKKWLCFIAAVMVAALVLTCNAHYAREYSEQFAQRQSQEDTQFQTALDMLRDFPTAAGKKK